MAVLTTSLPKNFLAFFPAGADHVGRHRLLGHLAERGGARRVRSDEKAFQFHQHRRYLQEEASVSIPLKNLFNQLTAFVFGGSPGILFCRVSPHPITF